MSTLARLCSAAISIALLIPLAPPLRAQTRGPHRQVFAGGVETHDSALSQAEIEQIRDARYYPSECILLFVKFLDLRTQEIRDLYAKPRKPGREQDTHDLLEQFTSIADELSDNLDDYGPRHADLRKALPKIIEASDRWSSTLKTPPDDPAYSVARKLALESIRDLRESTTELVSEQATWFKAHPPSKQATPETAPPIDIPR